jgi:Na+-driven multidrug efflux pump
MMDEALIDNLVVFSAIIYYLFLCLVYLLRAYERDKLELMLAPVFSLLLVPFVALWILNLLNGSDIGRLIAEFPIIIYLVYDLWYRLITKKKLQHHPDRWPIGLIVYLILLQIGSITLNWYGYIISKFHGHVLVISYFVMLGCFGFYQYRYNKRKKAIKN